ncbi:MAG: SUMF1/EgtB/PvdO family nonheme iron enzyme [Chloroflexaceae bacterium]|nr:SUMF1/EgtB/PvdO family nonheme iron enzyme [Chloroflexaceae bacterium]
MAGNVLEWLATPWNEQSQIELQRDFTTTTGVSLSGSTYWLEKDGLRCGARIGDFPYRRNVIQGFRVVRAHRAPCSHTY